MNSSSLPLSRLSIWTWWLVVVAVLCCSVTPVEAATKDQWKNQTIYQLITDRFAPPSATAPALTSPLPTVCDPTDQTWCGGNWRTIIENLDYIQSLGMTAIWISPVHANIDVHTPYNYAYHGYWVTDQRKLNPRFGTEDDLQALSKAVHDRGMYLMVDIVIQNVPLIANPANITVTQNLTTENGFWFTDPSEYHPYCAMDYYNTTSVEDCWLGDDKLALMDINTENANVIQSYESWIGEFVSNYTIDGLRIDAAKHVRETFWPGFCDAAGVFCIGEVFAQDMETIGRYADNMDAVMNYPVYYGMMDAFQLPGPANMSSLVATMNQVNATVKDKHVLGNFIENHDLPRFANTTVDPQLQFSALAFQFMGNDGIPIVYYGQEQGFHGIADPSNREALWSSDYANTTYRQRVSFLNQFRTLLTTSAATYNGESFLNASAEILSHDMKTIAIRKGPVISVLTNRGSPPTADAYGVINSGWPVDTALVDIWSCDKYMVGSGQSFQVAYASRGGRPVITVPLSLITNTSFCPSLQNAVVASTKYTDSSALPSTTTLSFIGLTALASAGISALLFF